MPLLYVADPLCSWCYGFGPELSRLLVAHPDTRVDLVMGGLRPYNTLPMTSEFRRMIRGHWDHVAEASGLPFTDAQLARAGFIYDTEPACRAVVTARAIDPARALGYLEAVQAAFYRDGRDATHAGVLADIAGECGYDRAAFLADLESDAAREATRGDFATAEGLGVRGFPTLALAEGSRLTLVSAGFMKFEALEEKLQQALRQTGGSPPRAAN